MTPATSSPALHTSASACTPVNQIWATSTRLETRTAARPYRPRYRWYAETRTPPSRLSQRPRASGSPQKRAPRREIIAALALLTAPGTVRLLPGPCERPRRAGDRLEANEADRVAVRNREKRHQPFVQNGLGSALGEQDLGTRRDFGLARALRDVQRKPVDVPNRSRPEAPPSPLEGLCEEGRARDRRVAPEEILVAAAVL